MRDDCGNEILVGDRVKVTALDSGRGAILGITSQLGEVVGFGRTRVELQFTSRTCADRVGAELLRVVEPVDGRELRKPSDVWNEGGRALPTRPPVAVASPNRRLPITNAHGAVCTAADAADYPLYAVCDGCGEGIWCVDGTAAWAHVADYQARCRAETTTIFDTFSADPPPWIETTVTP